MFYQSLFHIHIRAMAEKLPLVVILGATGCGKTKLSLELAQQFCGEIISADSMQIYKGLDIITAKATKEEQKIVPHYLIDFLEPHEEATVLQFRNRGLDLINNLFQAQKLPIVVGGTNYYIESLLWKILVDPPAEYEILKSGILPNNEHELPSEELHKKLSLLDPTSAKRLHPNNKRKILRSLEIFYKNGKKHSEIIADQQKSRDGLRYENAVIFWLQCDQALLDERLNSRVDSMVEEGLVHELTEFHGKYVESRLGSNKAPDYTRGIFQSIGFKEFHSFLMLNDEDRNTEKGKQLLHEGIEQLKTATRRYSRKQIQWIVRRFLGRTDRQVPPVYGLNASDVTQWNKYVTAPAIEIVQSYISQSEYKYERLPSRSVNSIPNTEDDTYVCDVCDRVFIGQHQWSIHIASNNHKKMLQRKHKRAKMDQESS